MYFKRVVEEELNKFKNDMDGRNFARAAFKNMLLTLDGIVV